MAKFLKINYLTELPNYIRKSSIISLHLITDVSNSEKPYTLWINTQQTCMSENFEDYKMAKERLDEIVKSLDE